MVDLLTAVDSSRAFGSIVIAADTDADLAAEEQITPKKMSSTAPGPSWSQLARVHWPDYVVLTALLVLLCILEAIPPYSRRIYHGYDGHLSDAETWRYSFPLKADTVPPAAVPMVAFLIPSGVFAMHHVLKQPQRSDTHAALLGLFGAVLMNAVITNFIKIMVGRPRPDFMDRCWPEGPTTVKWNADGTPACASTSIDPNEGRKSFPSGHTSWSTAGMGYLSLWLAGKLRAFSEGRGQPWRLIAASGPLWLAVYIGLTRIMDYWHHPTDVAAGFALGSIFAYTFYRQQYPALCAQTAGEAFEAQLPAGSNGGAGPDYRSLQTDSERQTANSERSIELPV